MERIRNLRIEISYNTIFLLVGIYVFFTILPEIKDILILIFIAFIIMSALEPLVAKLTLFGIPRAISVLFCYIFIIALVFLIGYFIISSFFNQTPTLVDTITQIPVILGKNFPALTVLVHNSTAVNIFHNVSNNMRTYLANISHNFNGIYSTSLGLVQTLTSFLAVIVMSIYMLIDKERNNALAMSMVSKKYKKTVTAVTQKIEVQLGGWLIGQFILSLIIAIAYWIVLSILHIPYALSLALLAAFFEVIPIVGPFLTGIMVTIVAAIFAPSQLLLVIISALIIQELEAHLFVPKIMDSVIGISPLITIIALLAGADLLGLIGVLLAVPFAAVIQILLAEVLL